MLKFRVFAFVTSAAASFSVLAAPAPVSPLACPYGFASGPTLNQKGDGWVYTCNAGGSPKPVPSIFDSLSNLLSGVTGSSSGAGSSGTTAPPTVTPTVTPTQNPAQNSGCPAIAVPAWMGQESVTSGPWWDGGGIKVPAPVIMPSFTLPAGGAGDIAQVSAIACPEHNDMPECRVGSSTQAPLYKTYESTVVSGGKPIAIKNYGAYGGMGTFAGQNTYSQQFVCDPQTLIWTLKRRDVPRDY